MADGGEVLQDRREERASFNARIAREVDIIVAGLTIFEKKGKAREREKVIRQGLSDILRHDSLVTLGISFEKIQRITTQSIGELSRVLIDKGGEVLGVWGISTSGNQPNPSINITIIGRLQDGIAITVNRGFKLRDGSPNGRKFQVRVYKKPGEEWYV